MSLLGRNVGIEFGQIVIIVLTLPALYILSRTRFYRPFFVVSSLVLASISLVWVFERSLEFDAGISRVVDAVVVWPRSLLFCVLATVVAAAIYGWERRNGRLVATGAPVVEQPEPAHEVEIEEPAEMV